MARIPFDQSVDHPFDALPAAQRATAHSTLSAVLGAAPITSVVTVAGGASGASTFRVETAGRRYMLRIEGPAGPLRNPHQYISMRIAAAAGIAPRLHYTNEVTRVAVMDFIEHHPLASYPGGSLALAQALGKLLRRVQSTPPFPRFVEYPDIVTRLWAHVCRTGLFAPGVLDMINEQLAYIRETYVWNSATLLSSHNDPLPSNILFDGERLWMIDWESSYRNDPLVDVAIMLDSFATTPELENALLEAWLSRIADEALYDRLAQVRALTRLYYAGVLLSASATAPRAAPDTDLAAPTLAEFREAIHNGQLKPGSTATKHVLGKMFLASFITGVTPPGFISAV